MPSSQESEVVCSHGGFQVIEVIQTAVIASHWPRSTQPQLALLARDSQGAKVTRTKCVV
jgi:hypothetical protein